jgi:hypothetical protein
MHVCELVQAIAAAGARYILIKKKLYSYHLAGRLIYRYLSYSKES